MSRKPNADEKKESRISLLMTASLYREVNSLADSQALSVNEYVSQLLEKAVQRNAQVIETFRQARANAKENYVDAVVTAN